MKTGLESSAWRTLRQALKKRYPRAHIQRIEDKSDVGIPDVNIHLPGIGEVWLEGKVAEVRGATAQIDLRDNQALWLHLRQRSGGMVGVWVRGCRPLDSWILITDDFGKYKKPVLLTEWPKGFSNADQMALAIGGMWA